MTDEEAQAGLLSIVKQRGPLSVADYMALCLTHPQFGYYRRRDAIGAGGDFITAPEISQTFGELIGIWCAAVWQGMGRPTEFRIVELGPGRGTLMRDLLRALHVLPECLKSVRVELMEISEALAKTQAATLGDWAAQLRWSTTLEASDAPTIIIANEFLDALPIRQLSSRSGGWVERCVADDGLGGLMFVDGPPASLPKAWPAKLPASDGLIVEVRTGIKDLCDAFARQSKHAPLAALFIDYGHTTPGYGDTLQAVHKHAYASPFANPGLADLTAQVDFTAFAHAATGTGLRTSAPLSQAEFLGGLGIIERTARLTRDASARQRAGIEAGVARLISPDAMGTRFKVIGLASSGVDLPILSLPR